MLANALSTLDKRISSKSQFLHFQVSGENLPNSSCHFPNHKSVFLQILYHFSVLCKITPLYSFRSNVIYFAQNEPVKVQIFETFECSGQFSPNSCHFWNKSVFLNFLHLSSVSWDITPLYFFDWNFLYFQQKWQWRVMLNLKKIWLLVSNMTWEIWWIFTQPFKSLKISFRWALSVPCK